MNTNNKFEKLRAAAYKSASDAVGAPDSCFDEAHQIAFHAALNEALNAALNAAANED